MEYGLIPANWSSNTILSAKQNLIQNSDLPPPHKFSPRPNEALFSLVTNIYAAREQEAEKDVLQTFKGGGFDNKLELSKALRLSQTRAREAERKLGELSKDKDVISNLLVEESLRLFTHKQWAKFLELQVKKLERQLKEDDINREKTSKFDNRDEGETSNMKWCAAIALCLAIAGVGFAFKSRISFSTTKFLFSFT